MLPFETLKTSPLRATLFVIAGFTVLRIGFAALLGFGIDESYTLGQARYLQLSYLDHPPLHLWIAHGWMRLAGLVSLPDWTVRLPFVALFAATSFMLYRLTARLFSDEAGFWAVLALNMAPFFFAAPGTWVLPDGPLLFGLVGGMLALAKLLFPRLGEEGNPWIDWGLAGLMFGIAGLSKYSALIVVLGLLGLMLTTHARIWLARPEPWFGALIAALVVSPVIIWNMQHGWASIAFQSGRAATGGLTPMAFGQMVLGQFVWLGPWIAVPLAATLALAFRGLDRARTFCLWLSLPSIVLFTIQALWSGQALPHWTMAGWFFALPVLGAWLAANPDAKPSPRGWAEVSTLLLVVVALGAGALARTGALTFAGLPPRADPTIDTMDWEPLRTELVRRGAGTPDGPVIVALHWTEAGKIDHALKGLAPFVLANRDSRNFAFRPYDLTRIIDHPALIVARRRTFEAANVADFFEASGPPEGFSFGRAMGNDVELVIVPGELTALPGRR